MMPIRPAAGTTCVGRPGSGGIAAALIGAPQAAHIRELAGFWAAQCVQNIRWTSTLGMHSYATTGRAAAREEWRVRNRRAEGFSEEEKRRIAGCGFGAAILIAPFIALLYSERIALAVLALALGSMTAFALDASRDAPEPLRRRLLVLAAIDGLFLTVTIAALVLR
jgi:hypothetical protein